MLKHRGFKVAIVCGVFVFGLAQAWAEPTKAPATPDSPPSATKSTNLFKKLLDAVKQATGGNDMQSFPQPPSAQTPPAPGTDLSGEARDPFSTTPTIESQATKLGDGSPLNSPIAAPVAFPTMNLRGFVSNGSSPSVAMLEIGDRGMFWVRAGDKLDLPAMELTIQEIQERGEFVKVRSQGETIEVRNPDKLRILPTVPSRSPARTPPAMQY